MISDSLLETGRPGAVSETPGVSKRFVSPGWRCSADEGPPQSKPWLPASLCGRGRRWGGLGPSLSGVGLGAPHGSHVASADAAVPPGGGGSPRLPDDLAGFGGLGHGLLCGVWLERSLVCTFFVSQVCPLPPCGQRSALGVRVGILYPLVAAFLAPDLGSLKPYWVFGAPASLLSSVRLSVIWCLFSVQCPGGLVVFRAGRLGEVIPAQSCGQKSYFLL